MIFIWIFLLRLISASIIKIWNANHGSTLSSKKLALDLSLEFVHNIDAPRIVWNTEIW